MKLDDDMIPYDCLILINYCWSRAKNYILHERSIAESNTNRY